MKKSKRDVVTKLPDSMLLIPGPLIEAGLDTKQPSTWEPKSENMPLEASQSY